MLEPYRVYLAPGGWRITDGVKDYGSFDSHSKAVQAVDRMNHRWTLEETRTFAPTENHQGGVALGDAQHKTTTDVARGDRRDNIHIVSDPEQGQKVSHLARPDHPIASQMVSETRGAAPDAPLGDVLAAPQWPPEPSVWEAREEDDPTPRGQQVDLHRR